ncbi:hypothetical protein RhiirA5_437751 [Rhizophagus irregularis]|uniref:Uncharacterized protein n=1 Tax=Rhizophagus irregularis TaxID=588596 RepID=A0A2N0NK29_9GLOM|nr:hypothetical protein RhiirA5_437751 [Rhizophagus irregularis]
MDIVFVNGQSQSSSSRSQNKARTESFGKTRSIPTWSSNPSELEVLRQHNTELEAKVAELEVFRQRNTELEVEKAKLEEVWRSRVTLQEKKLPSLKTRMRGSGRN